MPARTRKDRRTILAAGALAILCVALVAGCNGGKSRQSAALSSPVPATGAAPSAAITAPPSPALATAAATTPPSTPGFARVPASPAVTAATPLPPGEGSAGMPAPFVMPPSPSSAPPTPVATPLVPDPTVPTGAIVPGIWAIVNTRGGCLKVRLSLDPTSLLLDCLPYGTYVFVDNVQRVGADTYAHLAGRGYVFPAGLTPVLNPAEHLLPFGARPHDLGVIAYTTAAGDLWTVDADGGNPRRVVSADQSLGAFFSRLAWSPDGHKLLLQRENAAGGRVIQVYDGGQPHTVFPPPGGDPNRVGVAAWAADADHAFVVAYDTPGEACTRPANTVTIDLLDLATGATTPVFSEFRPGYIAAMTAAPNGASLAVLFGKSCEARSYTLCFVGLVNDPNAGLRAGALDCPGISAGIIAWSPDGRYLAYTARVQGRDDESDLPTGLPANIYDARTGAHYPLAYPLRYDSNVMGLAWESDGRTLDLEEEVPRGLVDVELPDRVIRRVSVDGSRPWAVLMAGDPLLSVRPVLAPGQTHAGYALAQGARGELWVIRMSTNDQRWQISPDAVLVAAWSP